MDEVSRYGSTGNLKAQKLTFLVELAGQKNGIRSAHYKFFRYQLGPYSRHLANDLSDLEAAGLLVKTTRSLTARGRFLHDYIRGAIRDDGLDADASLGVISGVATRYGRRSGAWLATHVYGLTVPVIDLGTEQRVRDVDFFIDILDPLHTAGLADVQLPADLVQDINDEIRMPTDRLKPEHPTYRQSVRRALSRIPA